MSVSLLRRLEGGSGVLEEAELPLVFSLLKLYTPAQVDM